MRTAAAGVFVYLGVLSLAQARPGNPERYPVGASIQGMGGVAVGAGTDAWHNPAGLGRLTQQGVSASVSAYGLTTESVPAYVNDSSGGLPIKGSLSSTSVDVFPADFAYVKPLGVALGLTHGIGLSVVVPDYDLFDGALQLPAEDLLLEMRARVQSESKTYWIVPGYGACLDGRFCVGVAPAAAIHLENDSFISTVFTEYANGSTYDTSTARKNELLAAALGVQLGAQVAVTDRLWVGLTLRSPVRTVYSRGSVLHAHSVVDTANNQAYVDRVEVTKPYLDYRQPWRLAAGVAYVAPATFSAALDLRLTSGTGDYVTRAGPNGEVSLPPTFPGGQIDDPSRAVNIQEGNVYAPAINVNLGGSYQVTDALAAQAGLFTDLSATPERAVSEYYQTRLSRVGLTLGMGYAGELATTWLALVYARGRGQILGYGAGAAPVVTDATSQSVMLMLGSTASLK
ncbi:MAG: hypothetical protein HY903_21150 [Deltaproteobacteria bacterium]|nr:hypothetical protein [Deltaproteobacteria bacterium]